MKEDWIAIAVRLIQTFEGCELEAYPDPATGGAPWTIGWGQTGAGIVKGVRWTQDQADEALAQEVQMIGKKIDTLALTFTDEMKGALVSFIYNVGWGNFTSSTLLKKIKARDNFGAADEFPKWNKAAGKVMNGLTKRRRAERAQFLLGA